MDDNRFRRVYLENKREKELECGITPDYNNRFQCLKGNNSEPDINAVRNAGRFECLRGDNYVSYPTNQNSRMNTSENNRFSCLVENNYQRYPQREYGTRASYLSKQTFVEEHKRIVNRPPSPPPMTFESEYHFPELGQEPKPLSNSQWPKLEIKTPELKPQRQQEMIMKPIPIKKETMTVLSLKAGKLVQKEVYEDGTEIPETGIIMIKKPNYSSWAALLKPEKTEIIYYHTEDNSIINMSGI